MPTRKIEQVGAGARGVPSAAYEAALEQFAAGVKLLARRDFAGARPLFAAIPAQLKGEPELAERAATYARICDEHLAGPRPEPATPDERFRRAVQYTNDGRYDDAVQLLNQALKEDPTSVDSLYVRASAWALQGAAVKAVADLREAIAIDPRVRFQAVNDPDFQKVREEPAFIDIIEPTPHGA
jgi:tetratricopeptide (TPR) repeat protein